MRSPSSIKMILLSTSSILFMDACGARLPKEDSIHRPLAAEIPLKLDEIELTKLQDGSPVNLGKYMRDKKLQFMVLTFGSQKCGACMEKTRYLQTNLVDDGYKILGTNAQGVIELVGISEDPASSRAELLNLVAEERLSHLTWSDPRGDIMMKYFQPSGLSFSVPLTVLISPTGIVWRIDSRQHFTPQELLQKIATTVDADAHPILPPVKTPPQTPPPVISSLASERPDRVDGVEVISCMDQSKQKLGALLKPQSNGFRAFLVHKGSCAGSQDCTSAKSGLQTWQSQCKSKWNIDCEIKELAVGDIGCGSEKDLLLGGQEFYDTFSDHFNWSYTPVVQSGKTVLPAVQGPLTFIFDSTGRLVFSKEGSLGTDLDVRMNADKLVERSPGPDFPIYFNSTPSVGSGPNKAARFSAIRASSKYTLVVFWNTWCTSCVQELEDWHKLNDSSYQFCTLHPEFCSVAALETGRDESGQEPSLYLKSLIEGSSDFKGWIDRKWTMPLMVEDMPLQDGRASTGWYQGWFRSRFGSADPRSILYDREGKVVGSWLAMPGEFGPRNTLKQFFETNQ